MVNNGSIVVNNGNMVVSIVMGVPQMDGLLMANDVKMDENWG